MQKISAFAKRSYSALLQELSPFNWLYIMRISICLIFVVSLSTSLLAATSSSGQDINQTVNLSVKNESLKSALNKLQNESGFNIFYSSAGVDVNKKVTLDNQPHTVAEVLALLLQNTGLTYKQENNSIIILPAVKGASNSEARRIFGIVLDESGRPLPGVTVRMIGERGISTATDENGHFHIEFNSENDRIIFSYVGYETQEYAVKDIARDIRITMKVSKGSLNEVVVIGYGTSTRKDLTGAVSSLTADDIAKQPVQDPLNALDGRVAGAVVTQGSGLPGAGVSILIRGQNSLAAGTVPLYVIDGVPFNINDGSQPASNNLNNNGLFGANGGMSPFSIINPNDIERIDILKDADATAIYGARGGNGVILITTKKGKAGRTKLDINLYQGIGQVAHYIPMLDLPQYLALRKQADKNSGVTPSKTSDPDLLLWDTTRSTNWEKKYLGGTAHLTDAQATLSGGTENTRFIFTNGFHRETTVFPGDFNDQKYTSHFSLQHNSVDKRFNMNLSVNYSYDYELLPSTDLSQVYNLPPDYPLYNPNGSIYWDSGGLITNPQSYLLQTNINKTNSLISNLQLSYRIFNGLDAKLNTGYNNISQAQSVAMPAASQNPVYSTPVNSARFANMGQSFYSIEPQLDYNKMIGKGHLSVLAGATLQRSMNNYTNISASGYSNPNLLSTASGASSYQVSSNYLLYKFSSLFGRVSYNWNEEIIVDGTLRRDGSSRFGSDHPFGTFYSVGGAWIFTKENFVKNALPFLSFGKIRGSFGLTGNDEIGDYQYLPTYNTGTGSNSYEGSSTLTVSRIPQPELQWESDRKIDAGLNLGFFKDRILFNVDYYRNHSSNQLGYLVLAMQSGENSYAGNLPALIQNRGFEFELNTINVSSTNFTWKTSVNLTVPRSAVLSVSPQYFYASSYVLGYPISQQKVYNFAGVNPQDGKPQFKTASGAITENPNYSTDRTVVENVDPKMYGGIGNDLTYGRWSLSFFFMFRQQNGVIYPGTTPGSITGGNAYASQTNLWSGPGSTSQYPEASTNPYLYRFTYGSSNAVYGNAGFVKLKNVSLSYNFPTEWAKSIGMSQFRIYAQGQNLYTWTKNKLVYDPETPTMFGVTMPPLRVITLGLNATF